MKKPSHSFGKWFTVKEAADYLQITEGSLRLLWQDGKITIYKMDGKFTLLQSELDDYYTKFVI